MKKRKAVRFADGVNKEKDNPPLSPELKKKRDDATDSSSIPVGDKKAVVVPLKSSLRKRAPPKVYAIEAEMEIPAKKAPAKKAPKTKAAPVPEPSPDEHVEVVNPIVMSPPKPNLPPPKSVWETYGMNAGRCAIHQDIRLQTTERCSNVYCITSNAMEMIQNAMEVNTEIECSLQKHRSRLEQIKEQEMTESVAATKIANPDEEPSIDDSMGKESPEPMPILHNNEPIERQSIDDQTCMESSNIPKESMKSDECIGGITEEDQQAGIHLVETSTDSPMIDVETDDSMPTLDREVEIKEEEKAVKIIQKKVRPARPWPAISLRRSTAPPIGLRNCSNDCFINVILQIWYRDPVLRQIIWDFVPNPEINLTTLSTWLVGGERFDTQEVLLQLQRIFFLMHTSSSSCLDVTHRLARNYLRLPQCNQDIFEFNDTLFERLWQQISIIDPIWAQRLAERFEGKLQNKTKCESCKDEQVEITSQTSIMLDMTGEQTSVTARLKKLFARKTEDGFSCKNCGQRGRAGFFPHFNRWADMLVIQLVRFTQDGREIRTNRAVTYPLELGKKQHQHFGKHRFALHAVILHEGEKMNCGHFYALVRTSVNQWYLMNDAEAIAQPYGFKPGKDEPGTRDSLDRTKAVGLVYIKVNDSKDNSEARYPEWLLKEMKYLPQSIDDNMDEDLTDDEEMRDLGVPEEPSSIMAIINPPSVKKAELLNGNMFNPSTSNKESDAIPADLPPIENIHPTSLSEMNRAAEEMSAAQRRLAELETNAVAAEKDKNAVLFFPAAMLQAIVNRDIDLSKIPKPEPKVTKEEMAIVLGIIFGNRIVTGDAVNGFKTEFVSPRPRNAASPSLSTASPPSLSTAASFSAATAAPPSSSTAVCQSLATAAPLNVAQQNKPSEAKEEEKGEIVDAVGLLEPSNSSMNCVTKEVSTNEKDERIVKYVPKLTLRYDANGQLSIKSPGEEKSNEKSIKSIETTQVQAKSVNRPKKRTKKTIIKKIKPVNAYKIMSINSIETTQAQAKPINRPKKKTKKIKPVIISKISKNEQPPSKNEQPPSEEEKALDEFASAPWPREKYVMPLCQHYKISIDSILSGEVKAVSASALQPLIDYYNERAVQSGKAPYVPMTGNDLCECCTSNITKKEMHKAAYEKAVMGIQYLLEKGLKQCVSETNTRRTKYYVSKVALKKFENEAGKMIDTMALNRGHTRKVDMIFEKQTVYTVQTKIEKEQKPHQYIFNNELKCVHGNLNPEAEHLIFGHWQWQKLAYFFADSVREVPTTTEFCPECMIVVKQKEAAFKKQEVRYNAYFVYLEEIVKKIVAREKSGERKDFNHLVKGICSDYLDAALDKSRSHHLTAICQDCLFCIHDKPGVTMNDGAIGCAQLIPITKVEWDSIIYVSKAIWTDLFEDPIDINIEKGVIVNLCIRCCGEQIEERRMAKFFYLNGILKIKVVSQTDYNKKRLNPNMRLKGRNINLTISSSNSIMDLLISCMRRCMTFGTLRVYKSLGGMLIPKLRCYDSLTQHRILPNTDKIIFITYDGKLETREEKLKYFHQKLEILRRHPDFPDLPYDDETIVEKGQQDG